LHDQQELANQLSTGSARAGWILDELATQRCTQFLELLYTWNKVHNLTGALCPTEAVSRHLLDSLSIAPLLKGRRHLDIGAGAGFPGLPLAICRPADQWTLLDSRGKRVAFLRQACATLELTSVEAVHNRAENYRPTENFDTLVSRAVAALPALMNMTRHLCGEGVRVIAMKGIFPETEIRELPDSLRRRADVVRLEVPGLDAARHAVVFDY
jgi:16S rRNA (guanine527-N7)-methyltransferase